MTLKQQHLDAILRAFPRAMYSKVTLDDSAGICEAITLEHMGKFAEWIDNIGYVKNNIDTSDPDYGKWTINWQDHFFTTELIALYFESLNPKP
jgi:hypothetical protein